MERGGVSLSTPPAAAAVPSTFALPAASPSPSRFPPCQHSGRRPLTRLRRASSLFAFFPSPVPALTSCAEDARSRSTYPGRESEHAEQTAALRAAASASSEEASALRARLESLSRERESLEERVQGLRRQAKSLEDDAARAEPRLRHELALYAHATRLSWDFSRRTRVAGSVAGNDDVRAFDFGEEERRENAVAVADALWEAVGDA